MASKLILDGGIALVTGAAAGIGKETAFAFAAAGVKGVVFADIDYEGARAVAEESKAYSKRTDYLPLAVKVDITSEDSVQNMVDTTVNTFGRIDYSVNSAGMGKISGAVTPNVKLDIFNKTMETNITGTMLCVRAVTHAMAKQDPLNYVGRQGARSLGRGSIVNLGSVNAHVPAPGMLPYTTSKHAIIGITKSAALDCLQSHIRINAVCPSWVDTPMMDRSLARITQLAQIIKAVSPLHRAATVEEVTDYIIFLCSPSASYINGTAVMIDAGATLTAHVT
ncbi:NAD(P)-binding protein [Nemania serpens]|nr:NAD(P)-binding protein [Nemania serpens]